MDAEGYLHLEGRLEEMINLGGIKVSPVEVEEMLMREDGVQEAAVVGLPALEEVSGILIKGLPRPERRRGAAVIRSAEARLPRSSRGV